MSSLIEMITLLSNLSFLITTLFDILIVFLTAADYDYFNLEAYHQKTIQSTLIFFINSADM